MQGGFRKKLDLATLIRSRQGVLDLSNRTLAEKIGVSGQMVSNYRQGSIPEPDKRDALAGALGVSRDDIERAIRNGNETTPAPQSDSPPTELAVHEDARHTYRAGIVHIPEINLEASCGDGSDPDGYRMERVNGELRLPEWYIRAEYGVAPERVMQIRTRGTSMSPTIAPGQKLLVAKREDEPIQDGMVYVIFGPHGLLIKRLFHEEDEDGRHFIIIHSDNRRTPRQTYRVPAERFGPGGDYRIVAFALEISKKL